MMNCHAGVKQHLLLKKDDKRIVPIEGYVKHKKSAFQTSNCYKALLKTGQLVGRENDVERIVEALSGDDCTFVTIDGQGGIGKTAIAFESASAAIEEAYFDDVICLNAPKRERDNVDAHNASSRMTYESIIDDIGGQFVDNFSQNMSLEEKQNHIESLFSQRPILLVLDNMETAQESQADIIARLIPLLGRAKAILTSRIRFNTDSFRIHLGGLDLTGSQALIRLDATKKGIQQIAESDPAELQMLYLATGGSPLAMKLLTGQLERYPLEVVLDNLKNIPRLNTCER